MSFSSSKTKEEQKATRKEPREKVVLDTDDHDDGSWSFPCTIGSANAVTHISPHFTGARERVGATAPERQ
jgi:hypothetical protein